jgi:hypothetical protein
MLMAIMSPAGGAVATGPRPVPLPRPGNTLADPVPDPAGRVVVPPRLPNTLVDPPPAGAPIVPVVPRIPDAPSPPGLVEGAVVAPAKMPGRVDGAVVAPARAAGRVAAPTRGEADRPAPKGATAEGTVVGLAEAGLVVAWPRVEAVAKSRPAEAAANAANDSNLDVDVIILLLDANRLQPRS